MEFINEDEPDLQQPNRPLQNGDVFLVGRREGTENFTSALYLRRHLVSHVLPKLGLFLDSTLKDTLYVKGPPGCGKTCFLSLWARLVSVQQNKRVLIVQFHRRGSCYVWIREAGGGLWRCRQALGTNNLIPFVDSIIDNSEESAFDLCVHDGVLETEPICNSMLGTLNTALANGIIKKVIHITSLRFSLRGGETLLGPSGPNEFLAIDSWHEEEYKDAVLCQPFVQALREYNWTHLDEDMLMLQSNDPLEDCDNNVTATAGSSDDWLLEVVKHKYFFAGGSARFMFDYNIASLKAELSDTLERVPRNDWDSFTEQRIYSQTHESVNSLMQRFGAEEGSQTCAPVSKYILFEVYQHCRENLTKSVRVAADSVRNPTLKGWAFELEQIEVVRSSLNSSNSIPKFVTNEQGLILRPECQVEFDETDLTGCVSSGRNTVIWCQKWNQGCFDVAFLTGGTLVTVQFTTHLVQSLKLWYVRRLREALLREGVVLDRLVHVGVRESNWTDFRFDHDTKGEGRQRGSDLLDLSVEIHRSPPFKTSDVPGDDDIIMKNRATTFMETRKLGA